MALSVGMTCGIATQLLMDCHPTLSKPGVLAPYTKDICDPIRILLEKEGVKMVEQTVECCTNDEPSLCAEKHCKNQPEPS